jgi:hypothetical protein
LKGYPPPNPLKPEGPGVQFDGDFYLLAGVCYTPDVSTLKGGDPVRVKQGSTGRHNSETGSLLMVEEFGE